jgi:hypothetical protein
MQQAGAVVMLRLHSRLMRLACFGRPGVQRHNAMEPHARTSAEQVPVLAKRPYFGAAAPAIHIPCADY